uniref:glutathione transferase n=1 Tax=Litchi chinensis TaxID=151069 RepID=A0A0U4JDT8_LITCN|nr:GST5 [Litchi chinensis]
MGEEVKLHGLWCSPFTLRVVWALKLKGVAYEYVEEDLCNKSALLLRYNPIHKKVPVLLHAGKPICESMIIIEYIEEVWPHTPLLPTDPYDRATARFWIKFIEDKGVEVLRRMFRTTGEGEDLEVAIKEGLKMLEPIEEHGFEGKKYFNGEEIGMVDIAFGSVIQCLTVIEDVIGVKLFEAHKFPRLHKWYQNFLQVPVIKENLPDHDKFIVYYKNRRETLLASSTLRAVATS